MWTAVKIAMKWFFVYQMTFYAIAIGWMASLAGKTVDSTNGCIVMTIVTILFLLWIVREFVRDLRRLGSLGQVVVDRAIRHVKSV
jgi:hypothetical protein